jgi:hypothetical protein
MSRREVCTEGRRHPHGYVAGPGDAGLHGGTEYRHGYVLVFQILSFLLALLSCPAHLISLDFIILIILSEECVRREDRRFSTDQLSPGNIESRVTCPSASQEAPFVFPRTGFEHRKAEVLCHDDMGSGGIASPFLTSALDGGERSAPRLGETVRRLDGPHSPQQQNGEQKIVHPSGIEPGPSLY